MQIVMKHYGCNHTNRGAQENVTNPWIFMFKKIVLIMLQVSNIFTFFSYYTMETCGIVWIKYNEYKIFKKCISNVFLFFSFIEGLKMILPCTMVIQTFYLII